MRRLAAAASAAATLLAAGPAAAETEYPALHAVRGVAAGDVLNIRAEPAATAPVVATLAPGAAGVEVVEVSPDGRWGRVNRGETSGWAALRFLAPEREGPWHDLATPLLCFGTEPFWSLDLDAPRGRARLGSATAAPGWLDLGVVWTGSRTHPVAAAAFARGAGFLTIRAGWCSDGMSEGIYGLAATLFLTGAEAERHGDALHGCCTLEGR